MYIVKQLSNAFGVLAKALLSVTTNGSSAAQVETDLNSISSNATAKYKQCYQTLAYFQMGTTCLLASGSASDNVNVTGSNFNVTFNTALNGEKIETDCLAVYDALCTIISGKSLLYSSINGTVPSVSGDSIFAFASACRALSPYNSCNGNSTCVADKRAMLVSQLVKPYNYNIFFNIDFLDGVENFFKGLGDKIKGFFSLRVLADSTSVNYNATASSGDDIYNAGVSSGTTPPEAKGCALAAVLLVLPLLYLF